MSKKIRKLVSLVSCLSIFSSSANAVRNRYGFAEWKLKDSGYDRKSLVRIENRSKKTRRGVRTQKKISKSLEASRGVTQGKKILSRMDLLKKRIADRKHVKTGKISKWKRQSGILENFISYVKMNPGRFSSEVLGASSVVSMAVFAKHVASLLRTGEDFYLERILKSFIARCGGKLSSDDYLDLLRIGGIDIAETYKKNYSIFAAGCRTLRYSRKSAPERERVAFMNMNVSSTGACWDLALKVDYVARKLGFRHHHLLAYKIVGGVPHTFNLVSYDGKEWYIFDPLADNGMFLNDFYDLCEFIYRGRTVVMSDDYMGNYVLKCIHEKMSESDKESDANDLFARGVLNKYKGSNNLEKARNYYKYEFRRYGYTKKDISHIGKNEWYVMEQVNEDEKREVRNMKWIKFLPGCTWGDAGFDNKGGPGLDEKLCFAHWGEVSNKNDNNQNNIFSTLKNAKENRKVVIENPNNTDYKYSCPFNFFG